MILVLTEQAILDVIELSSDRELFAKVPVAAAADNGRKRIGPAFKHGREARWPREKNSFIHVSARKSEECVPEKCCVLGSPRVLRSDRKKMMVGTEPKKLVRLTAVVAADIGLNTDPAIEVVGSRNFPAVGVRPIVVKKRITAE